MISGCVAHMPCDSPGYTFNEPRFKSLIASSAESAIGTT